MGAKVGSSVKEHVFIYDNAMFYPRTAEAMLKRKGGLFRVLSVSVAPFRGAPGTVVELAAAAGEGRTKH